MTRAPTTAPGNALLQPSVATSTALASMKRSADARGRTIGAHPSLASSGSGFPFNRRSLWHDVAVTRPMGLATLVLP
jgi:hypothetical protein